MKNPIRPGRLSRRHVAFGTGAFVWLLALVFGLLPIWRGVRDNAADIQALEGHIASFSKLSSSGVWLAEAARLREPEVNEAYLRLFPAQKGLDSLYLELTRIAQSSGVEPLQVREAKGKEAVAFLPEWQQTGSDEGRRISELLDLLGSKAPRLPDGELKSHRLRVQFTADYRRLARFLDQLRVIPRAVSVHRLRVEPAQQGISVDLELEYYVRSGNQSA